MTGQDTRWPAGEAHYPGDCSHMVGEVKGPTTFDTVVVATEATYDPATDRTTVRFTTTGGITADDIAPDEFGTLRVRDGVL